MRDFTPFAHKLFRKRKKNRPTNIFAVLLHPLLKKYLHKFYIIHPTIIYTAFTYFTPKLFTELLRPSLSNCLRGFYIIHTQKFKELYILLCLQRFHIIRSKTTHRALTSSLQNYLQSFYIVSFPRSRKERCPVPQGCRNWDWHHGPLHCNCLKPP